MGKQFKAWNCQSWDENGKTIYQLVRSIFIGELTIPQSGELNLTHIIGRGNVVCSIQNSHGSKYIKCSLVQSSI